MFAYYSKWLFVIIAFLTGLGISFDLMPEYHQFSNKDILLWLLAFTTAAVAQAMLLACKVSVCYTCRLWSDFLLQVKGLLFILLAAAFTAKYPPFSWAMVVFPVLGVVCLVLGRVFSKTSRLRLRGYKHNGAFGLLD